MTSDTRAAVRALIWAARALARETVVDMVPPRRQTVEMLAEALRDPRIAELESR